ncbi:cold-shock protein [Streptomyces hypolithicus]
MLPRPGAGTTRPHEGATATAQDTVKWFSAEKGFGSIQQDAGPLCLQEDQRVEYEVTAGPKGSQATQVRPI